MSESSDLILKELTKEAADIFDNIYNFMIRTMQFVFANTQVSVAQNKVSHLAVFINDKNYEAHGRSINYDARLPRPIF